MRRTAITALIVLVVAALGATFYFQGNRGAHSQADSGNMGPISTGSYLYYTLKDATGFVIARAPMGAQHQPLATPQAITLIESGFGLAEPDSVSSMQLSPDGAYLAINGSTDHGDLVFIYDTHRLTVSLLPANVSGNFLHWLPRGNGHSFLYRPMLPLGPDALTNGAWNPGLWIVDAARGSYRNIDLQMPSAFLVDAAASPDGTKIVYATTQGLGLGSDTWLMNSDGSAITHLFSTTTGPRSIAGLFAWSPDSHSIAYERLSDSSTPFLPAGLWIMNSRGGAQRWLTSADGGHGYMPVWSPDGSKIAFIARTNPHDHLADEQEQALQCAIGIVDLASKHMWLAATAAQTGMQWNINPTWSSDSTGITFTALNPANHVLGGTPRYWSVSATSISANTTPLTTAFSHIIATS